ncbi:hypothetical protein PF005_g19640 [Phytophthora fragariae]|uniref:Secreted protein n=1 Tax=Phytophthora fragariae TaxID=53985 RepID=A0A6A3XZT9_9STRA|nr:hypothetical protein PF003_g14230 [Phytophthora fragariae]KAE8929415.1 hypothetical protein PF009_g20462 [Phytophthora fragariae]KAE8990422.1 hypothetical protein PF011_g18365 [Phytophthora fragariae]KAE9059872.1 hypothetical protein PF010_g30446 [Phytophthora fragariae]KAE9091299.1 hypothetical protein PF007_g18934 [Phytophthora fragariae]
MCMLDALGVFTTILCSSSANLYEDVSTNARSCVNHRPLDACRTNHHCDQHRIAQIDTIIVRMRMPFGYQKVSDR